MRTWTKVVAALAAAVVLAVGGLVVLVSSGAAEDWWSSCTDADVRRAEAVADVVRRELPQRRGAVEVVGACDKQPLPDVVAHTSADRAALAADLRERWDCRQQDGTSPPVWDCADAGGYAVEVDAWDDGQVTVTLDLDLPS